MQRVANSEWLADVPYQPEEPGEVHECGELVFEGFGVCFGLGVVGRKGHGWVKLRMRRYE